MPRGKQVLKTSPLCLLLLLLFLVSCANTKACDQMKLDLAEVKEQMQACRKKQNQIAASAEQMQRSFSRLEEKVAHLEERLRNLERSELESISSQSQEGTDTDQDQKLKPSRADQLGGGVSKQQASVKETASSRETESYSTGGDDLYNQALAKLRQGDVDEASEMFQEYLESFPNTPLTDNAAYWLAECFYHQRKFTLAADYFQRVIDRYPNGDKVAAATLKLGYSYFNLGDLRTARSILQDLMAEYPKSEEALLAQKMVDRINSPHINLTH
ncbi:MAG: tol-pal system protein YbgF [bacterium]|nr:tol-pal system protein YbgF [bacterium]